jgi:hypothetical protein
MAEKDKKTESTKDTEREPTIRDLDLSEKEREDVKGGIGWVKLKQDQ